MRSERDGVFIRTCLRPTLLSNGDLGSKFSAFIDDPSRDPHHPMLRVGCIHVRRSIFPGSMDRLLWETSTVDR